jgi:arylsulfatase A-like enzyme
VTQDPRTLLALRRCDRVERMRAHVPTLVAATVLFLGLACGPKPTAEMEGRGVLVIAIDGLRADHVGVFGYDRPTTQSIDGLAAQGVAFTSAWSASPDMLAAHAAILTGCDPLLARRPDVKVNGPESELAAWYIPDGLPCLAQQFLAHGYATAAFVDHPSISPVRGFARGFQEFAAYREDAVPRNGYGFEVTAARFRNWIPRDPAQSWFAYLQIDDLERVWQRSGIDPHYETLYAPRPELEQVPPVADAAHVFFAVPRARWSGGTLSLGEYEARYDGALKQLDAKIRRLLESMSRIGWLKHTTVVIVGTFGTSLGESGLYLDSGTLSDVDLRVPIVIRPALAASFARGRNVDRLASTIDLAPTLLDLHGIPVPKGMQGVSLKSLLEGGDAPVRQYAFASGGLQEGRAVIDAHWCYERSFPGRGQDRRARESWYGDARDHGDEPREFLHDRRTNPTLGHVEDSSNDPIAGDRLPQVSAEWFDWIERAARVLHARPGTLDRSSRPMIDELVRRGMLPPGS